MKKKFLFVGLAVASLAVTTVIVTNNVKYRKVDASDRVPISGLYHKVTQLNEISIGDDLLFLSGVHAPHDFWANPAYFHATATGISLTDDNSYAYLTNSPATLLTVCEGLTDDTYALKAAKIIVTNQNKDNIYIGYNNREYFGDNTFVNVGYFYGDRTGPCVGKSNTSEINTEWTFKEENGGVTAQHALGGALSYTDDYASRFCRYARGASYLAYAYKKVQDVSYAISVTTNPTKMNYYHGDEIDLSGMVISLTNTTGTSTHEFDKNKSLFSYPKNAYGNGSQTLNINFAGYNFELTIAVSRENNSAYLAPARNNYRGTYMIAALTDATHGFAFNAVLAESNAEKATTPIVPVYGKEGRWASKTDQSDQDNNLRFEIDMYDSLGGYSLKGSNDTYLLNNGEEPYIGDGPYEMSLISTEGGVRVASGRPARRYMFLDNTGIEPKFQFSEDINEGIPVYLYKYDSKDEDLAAVDTYIANFLEATKDVDYEGIENNITKAIWDAQTAAFEALSLEAKGIICNTTYVRDQESPGTINYAMNRYDFIVRKFQYLGDYDPETDTGEDWIDYITYDFMFRWVSGTMVITEEEISDDIIELINNIGDVTYTDESRIAIERARKSYENSDLGIRHDVTNYQALLDAEEHYALLESISNLTTTSALSYHYSGDSVDGFTFSNINIRFGALMNNDLWVSLANKETIEGYGILIGTSDVVPNNKHIKDYYGEDTVTDYFMPKSQKAKPTTATAAQKGDLEGDYLIWNLKQSIEEKDINKTFVVAAYIKTTTQVIFLQEVRYSVASLANDYLENRNYEDDAGEGSLAFLAGLMTLA